MALNAKVQSAYKNAWDAQAAHVGDEVTIGVDTVACTASVIDKGAEDQGGGDRATAVLRVQVAVDDLSAGVPAMWSLLTYKGESYKIENIQETDDETTVTLICQKNL